MRRRLFQWLIKLRNRFSKTIEPLYRESDFVPPIPETLPELRQFIRAYYEWKSDPIYGLLDHVKSVKAMNYSLENKDIIIGDCDDLATYTAWMLLRMGGYKVYRVNIPTLKHVICVFERVDGQYQVADNRHLRSATYPSLDTAVKLWAKVRKQRTLQTKHYISEPLSMEDVS